MERSTLIAIVLAGFMAIGMHASAKLTRNNFCNSECNNNICEGVENYTALPNEAGCEHFFVCIDGRPIPNTCPRGQWFNPESSQCDSSANPCDFQFECPSDGIHFFPHDEYCDKFITCFAGFPILINCADGLYFDRELGQCNFPEYVECNLEVCPPEIDPKNVTFLPSDNYCDKYYICYSGEAMQFRCPGELHFNPISNTCDFPENVNCSIEEPPEAPVPVPVQPQEIECNYADSIYFVPHPNSCEHYFICSRGHSVLFNCPAGFYFDRINFWCDISENVQCETYTPTDIPTTAARPPCQNILV